ncbi:MAG: DUF1972 domain-containing protein [Flavobacteriaceae bacterium]|nr:DUF1972 domain-containing protein [Bacteroidia bacterium]MBT8286660.1 DUF1972 domain-containing protein [Bacteroidia bacterium]NNF75185.1 DUF1972 domain-containing protein [Flavobacteriaceae bacterium]NNK72442.1 DUF1972 domain-containing protein [Flavobacteriaceae bacterium]
MKIGILGTRGIPNHHGGFEQFAEFFAVYLVEKGHKVAVYNSSCHPFQESSFQGVEIIHCYDPEDRIGTAGQFIYDFNCIMNSRKRKFDILLQLGYTSSSVWSNLLPKGSLILTNMDGLEWKRSKYSKPVRRFLKYAERQAVKKSDFLIADSLGIQDYLLSTYNAPSEYIAYGATLFDSADPSIIADYGVEKGNYNMLIARLEPENNIEVILDGALASENQTPFLVVGKNDVNSFGKYLTNKYKKTHIRFCGGIYNLKHLNNLRYFSNLYFHGHSVGGTNPSLLEAMASNALIVAHENPFNQSVLKDGAFYFQTPEQIGFFIDNVNKEDHMEKLKRSKHIIANHFNWNLINNKYLEFFNECITEHR